MINKYLTEMHLHLFLRILQTHHHLHFQKACVQGNGRYRREL